MYHSISPNQVFRTKWVVYAKQPFASPKTVVEYLGRYTHKIAISNHRLIDVNENSVTFHYKDYRPGRKKNNHMNWNGVPAKVFFSHTSSRVICVYVITVFWPLKNKTTQLNLAKKDLHQPEWRKINYYLDTDC